MKLLRCALFLLGLTPAARAEFFLRDTIPDLFDLGSSRGARVAFTAPDSGANTYDIDAAAGAWADLGETNAAGVIGLVGEFHRANQSRNPTNSRRFLLAGWTVLGLGEVFLPTSEGLGWQRDVVRGVSSYQGYVKSSLVVAGSASDPAGSRALPATLPAWRRLIWSTSYAPLGAGLLAAGSPSIGLNYQSADSGGTGHVVRATAEYAASIRGAPGPLERFSLDAAWIYQRRLGGTGTLAAAPRDSHRLRLSLGYDFADGVALVVERVDGEDPFAGLKRSKETTLALRVRLGKGPAGL